MTDAVECHPQAAASGETLGVEKMQHRWRVVGPEEEKVPARCQVLPRCWKYPLGVASRRSRVDGSVPGDPSDHSHLDGFLAWCWCLDVA